MKALLLLSVLSVTFAIINDAPQQTLSALETGNYARSMCWIFARVNAGGTANCERFKVTLEECIPQAHEKAAKSKDYDLDVSGPWRLKDEADKAPLGGGLAPEEGYSYLFSVHGTADIADVNNPPNAADVAAGDLQGVFGSLKKAVFSSTDDVMNNAVINYYQCKINGNSKVLKVGTGDDWAKRYGTIGGEFNGAIPKIVKLCEDLTADLMMCRVVAGAGNDAKKDTCVVENIEWALRHPPSLLPWNYRDEANYKTVQGPDGVENWEKASGGWITEDIEKSILNCKCNQLRETALEGLFTVHELKPCIHAKWDQSACARYKAVKAKPAGYYNGQDTSVMDEKCP